MHHTSFPWIASPRLPPWCNPRKGIDHILPSGNTAPFIVMLAKLREASSAMFRSLRMHVHAYLCVGGRDGGGVTAVPFSPLRCRRRRPNTFRSFPSICDKANSVTK